MKKISDVVNNYPQDVLNQVIPDYWKMKTELYTLSEKITEHRGRKDIGAQIGVTFDRYVEDIESVKSFYKTVIACGASLDECHAKYRKKNRRDWKEKIIIAVISSVVSVTLTLIGKHYFF